ncbi:MAG TPA: hypothetical protein VIV15_01615, partial [Anaerolineales bacterium]
HHLSVLAADGRIAPVGKRRDGRGRPETLYSLSPALAGDNLPALLDAALTEWLASLAPEQQAALLASLGRRMAGAGEPASVPLVKRLNAVVEKLNKLHYSARWEAGAEGPRLILGRCPYAAVIASHPELCRMDSAMLSASLNRPLEQKAKLQPSCIFQLR